MEDDPSTAVTLRRLRLPLEQHDSDLILVGDTFDEGGRYVQLEIHRSTSEAWTWTDWDDAYDQLARSWHGRAAREQERQD